LFTNTEQNQFTVTITAQEMPAKIKLSITHGLQ